MIIARAPLRISFGGGGTDIPTYSDRFGGMVVSTAIRAACHVTVGGRRGPDVVIASRDYRQMVTVPARLPIAMREPLPLPRAVLAWFAAQGLRPAGLRIETWAEVPPGSGLGSSSAMTAALVCAIAQAVGLPLTQRRIAEVACEIELDLLGRPIGRQDQYASAIGGLNVLSFTSDGVEVTALGLPAAVERSLQQHLLLVSTRKTRDSASVLRSQREASRSDGEVTERLHRIRALAAAMSEALRAGDLPGFGALLDENWQLKRGLARGVTSAEIDHWYATARAAGVYGGKISGAGGGGFFLFCVPPARWQRVVTALQQEGLDPFPVAFDHCGCVVREEPILAGLHARHGLKGGLLETVHPG